MMNVTAISSMSNKPLISIVIPAFNAADKIGHCLESICSQNYESYEVLVMDGLSSDNTRLAVSNFQSRNPRIAFFCEKDAGTYDAMNKGIEKAIGSWLLFLGADDELFDMNVLAEISAILEKTRAEVVYGDVLIAGETLFGKNGDRYDGQFSKAKIIKRNICHQSVFYHEAIFKKLGKYNPDYVINADWDLNLHCFSQLETFYVPLIVTRFSGGGQSSRLEDKFNLHDRVINARNYFKISYLDKKFIGEFSVFRNIAIASLKEKKYLDALFFILIAMYQGRMQIGKHLTRRLNKQNTGPSKHADR